MSRSSLLGCARNPSGRVPTPNPRNNHAWPCSQRAVYRALFVVLKGFGSIKRNIVLSVLFTLFTILSIIWQVNTASAAPGINKSLNYQGKLLTASSVPVQNGTYQAKFTIYDALSGGNALWTASGTVASPQGIASRQSIIDCELGLI